MPCHSDLVKKFECWAPDATAERIYRFGDNPAMESPHKRLRRHTPDTPVKDHHQLRDSHHHPYHPSRSPWRLRHARTPTRRGSRVVRTLDRWTSSPSSKGSCSETPVTGTALPVANQAQTDGLHESSFLSSWQKHHPPSQSSQKSVEGDGHRQLPLEGPGHPVHRHHHHHQQNPENRNINIKEMIKEINAKENIKQEKEKKSIKQEKDKSINQEKEKSIKREKEKLIKKNKIQKQTQNKKKEESREENKVNEQNEVSEEDVEKIQIQVQIPIQSNDSYLREPGPGTWASSGCLGTPCWTRKVGEKSSPSHISSSGAIRSFTVVHGSSEDGESSGVENLKWLSSTSEILGTDSYGCSTAATDSSSVLAGNKISNYTLGGKTTSGRCLLYSKDEEISLSGQLGQLSGRTRTSQGIYKKKNISK